MNKDDHYTTFAVYANAPFVENKIFGVALSDFAIIGIEVHDDRLVATWGILNRKSKTIPFASIRFFVTKGLRLGFCELKEIVFKDGETKKEMTIKIAFSKIGGSIDGLAIALKQRIPEKEKSRDSAAQG